MQTTLLWTGREYHSMEHCLVRLLADNIYVNSTIVGFYQEKIYKVDYFIQLNKFWETLYFKIECHHGSDFFTILFEGDGKGNWTSNGEPEPQFKGCVDIDIPLTPFTNTLPIKRLQLKDGGQTEIQVVYLDLLSRQIHPVKQRYQRRSRDVYHYENVPNDFEADVVVDDVGFVIDYPALFMRTARHDSSQA